MPDPGHRLPSTTALGLEAGAQPASVGEEVARPSKKSSREHEVSEPSLDPEVELVTAHFDLPDEGGVVLPDEPLGMRLKGQAPRPPAKINGGGKRRGNPSHEAVRIRSKVGYWDRNRPPTGHEGQGRVPDPADSARRVTSPVGSVKALP